MLICHNLSSASISPNTSNAIKTDRESADFGPKYRISGVRSSPSPENQSVLIFTRPVSIMPASLLALANELLLAIADSPSSERSINTFARTNRRLYLVIKDYLYKNNVIKSESSALWWAAIYGQSNSAAKSIAQLDNVNIHQDAPADFWKPGFTNIRRH